jgi:hypothetical protein
LEKKLNIYFLFIAESNMRTDDKSDMQTFQERRFTVFTPKSLCAKS